MAALALYIHVFVNLILVNQNCLSTTLHVDFQKAKRFGVKWVMTNLLGRKRLCWINQ